MLVALVALAFAASDPPPLDPPPSLGAHARKDAAAVLGTQDYASLPDAPFALADAEAFSDFLVNIRGVAPERVHRVGDGTRSSMRTAVSTAAREVRPGGTLWIFVAGHGALDASGKRLLLAADVSPDAFDEGSLPLSDVLDLAASSKAKQVLVVTDVGYGGRGRDGEHLFDAPTVAPAALPDRKKVVLWSATTGTEPAYEWKAAGHGMFSYLAVGGLRGWADGQADGAITVGEAQGYVAKLVRSIGGGEEKPTRDARADVLDWTLVSGAREEGPSKDLVAALALAEKSRRVHAAEASVLGAATAEWAVLAPTTTAPGPASETALHAFIAKYDTATVSVDGADVAVAVPEVNDARARLDDFSRVVRKATKRKRRTSRGPRTPAPPPPPPASPCGDLLAMEPAAIAGELAPDAITCIESRIAAETKQTTRDKLSRLLLVNADAKGDTQEWARLAERHLEEIDRSDPDLCFKYALFLSRGDIDDAPPVLKWTSYALENKHVWEGPTYVSRVYNLLRLRAETASRLWHEAEKDFLEDRSDENADLSEQARGQAKDFAKEWLDYARASGQPVEFADQLCKSAAGSAAFCDSQ